MTGLTFIFWEYIYFYWEIIRMGKSVKLSPFPYIFLFSKRPLHIVPVSSHQLGHWTFLVCGGKIRFVVIYASFYEKIHDKTFSIFDNILEPTIYTVECFIHFYFLFIVVLKYTLNLCTYLLNIVIFFFSI